MPFVEYFAYHPLFNWFQLHSGPGAAPLKGAAAAYSKIGDALKTAASGTDRSTVNMENSWDGLASERARAAFRNHSSWVRDQATLADRIAQIADDAARDHGQAIASMPTFTEIMANQAKREAARQALAASAASSMGVGLGVSAMMVVAAELEYLDIKRRAGTSMARYEVQATATVQQVLAIPIELPPPIVNNPQPASELISGSGPQDHTGTLNQLLQNGPDTGSGPTGPDSSGPGGDGLSDPGVDQIGEQITDPAQNLPGELSEPAMQDLIGQGDPGGQVGPELFAQDELYGTSSSSPALAAMGGGMGSLVGLGMLGGGLGSMSGAATGFRMPTGWKPGTGTAFGAGTGTPSTAPVGRPTRPGVSAPTARMRRRRKEDEDKPGKVFAPGEQIDVPVLERPPAIGVIEYEPDDELIVDDTESVLVGVLDRLDDDSEDARRHESR